jgi:signal transduction histidine kinase/PleD family two-component response regulator
MVAMTTPELPPKEQVRILVVDDHPNTAATLARALSQLGTGVNVVSASSGPDALEKVKNIGVDILFTDMIMPEMTGLELIEKLQSHPAGRPAYTYLVTAYDVPGLKVTAQRLKVNEVIVKPVRPERICQIAVNAIEEMKHSTKPVKKTSAGKKKFKVLVADDKADNVTLLTRYLEYEGYENITASDGLETLNKVRDEMPDLVLLDVNMPNMDGFTVLKEIRSDPAIQHIPVIILTAARLDPADVQSGLNLGADDYVTKPFDRHELMARIRTKLRVKATEDIIRRRNRELSILPEIGKGLSARTDINELLSIVLRRSVETLGAITGYALVMDQDGAPLKKSYSTSDIEMDFPKLDEFFGTIENTHEGLIINDTRNDNRWQTGQLNLLHSAVIVPMFGRNSMLGLLVLAHEEADYFESAHLLLLQAIASQAAIAIENANLYATSMREKKRLAAVLEYAAEAILMFDKQGRLCLLNPEGEKLFTDFTANLNQPLPKGRGYDALIGLLDDVRTSQGAKSSDITWPDQRTFTALISPIEAGGGQIAILHDVTRFTDLDRVKNEFIATASHDLKNPITTISGFITLLEQAGPLNKQQRDFVTRIQSATLTMRELVQNMMSLAQMDLQATPKHESVELGELLAGIIDEFAPQATAKNQKLHFTPFAVPTHISGDQLQLKQLFRNLVGNAIKYSSPGGNITLGTKVEKEKILVNVQDTGYGIPAADLPFIFDRFYRVRNGKNSEEEGNGLGLAIVKSIVEQHSGQVNVQSEVNKGSCFTITLPLASVETTMAKPVR